MHRGKHAVYLEVGGWCVGVVDQLAVQVPCALGARTADLGMLGSGPAYLSGGVLHLSGVPLVIGRLRRVEVPALRIDAAPRPDPVAPMDADAVNHLVGAGDGLTPRGDDVLCGWLAMHRAVGAPTPGVDNAVRSRMQDTTLLSATLLDCALHGEVLPQFAAYVVALGTPAQAEAEKDLLAVGHSTGSGLLEGARWAAAELCASIGEPA